MQRATVLPCRNFRIGLPGPRQRVIARQRDDAAQLGIEFLQTIEINLREPLGCELAIFDPLREVRDGGKRDVVVLFGQRPGIRQSRPIP